MATAFKPVPLADSEPDYCSGPLDRMIAIQCEAYPSDWSDADKREMAEIHLFGSAV